MNIDIHIDLDIDIDMDVNTDIDPGPYPSVWTVLKSQPRTMLPLTYLQHVQCLLATLRKNGPVPPTGLYRRGK